MSQGPKSPGSTESEQFESYINQLYWELPTEDEPDAEKEKEMDEDK